MVKIGTKWNLLLLSMNKKYIIQETLNFLPDADSSNNTIKLPKNWKKKYQLNYNNNNQVSSVMCHVSHVTYQISLTPTVTTAAGQLKTISEPKPQILRPMSF